MGVITIDGTKIKANASMDQNRSYRDLVTQILREAEEIDQAEDRLHGKDRRGDELPEELRTAEGRRQALEAAKRRLEERKDRPIKECAGADRRLIWSRSCSRERCCVVAGGASGRRSRAASSKLTAPSRHSRSRAIERIGWSMCLSASSRTIALSWALTRPMTGGARAPATRRAGC